MKLVVSIALVGVLALVFLIAAVAYLVHHGAAAPLTPESLLSTEAAPPPFACGPPASTDKTGFNYALAAHGAKAQGGNRPELLIDGNSTQYGGADGFAYTFWRGGPQQSFIVALKEPSTIDCVRFLLWDTEENRYYRYRLEVSTSDEPEWTTVADKSTPADECRSWQVIRFRKQPVKQIRLTGTFNSSNSQFHVVELQALLAPPNGFTVETPPPPKETKGAGDPIF